MKASKYPITSGIVVSISSYIESIRAIRAIRAIRFFHTPIF